MIARSDILSISYFKKAVFTGSFQGMRYRLEKVAGEDSAERLKATVWEAPYSFDVTADEKKESCEFPFSEEGICQAVDWMNGKWESQPERWKQAVNNWK